MQDENTGAIRCPGSRSSNLSPQFMNVSGEFTVPAPRNVVFRTLRNANSFVQLVDGVEDLREKQFAQRLQEAFSPSQ
jgi:hypothetical protein